MKLKPIALAFTLISLIMGCETHESYDLVIRNGIIADGSGGPSFKGDIAINADTIVAVRDLKNAAGAMEIDATGLTVAPGFINMLSWANVSLIEDGRSQG
ncbi:MAG: D-aminoacylase, partial [Eudoraea sp.]